MLSYKCKFLNPALLILLLFSNGNFANSAADQNTQTAPVSSTSATSNIGRPKIGLVLSGGGARGFAHIGVLKVLEQNNVPIDYIAGTSVGSIIGGLYAMGLTPEDIENGIKEIAWQDVFDDFAIRDYKSFRRKQDDIDFFNVYRIGVTKDGLQIPPGLIEGQQIELALDRLAYPGFEIDDFDNLRIPYRAIAADIATGEPFVIAKGNIARAMRASMSIPGALPPISIDGTLLVDGGIANNIPIDVVRNMGADIVIVVDVSNPLSTKGEIESGIDVTGQLTTILTRRIANTQLKTLKGNDILIIPGEKEITSSDFEKHDKLIQAGIIAAKEKLDSIQRLSLTADAYSDYQASLAKVADKRPIINFVEINNQTSLRDDVIRSRIGQKMGEPLDVDQLEQDLSYIYGLDYSSSVVYSLEQRDGITGLIIYARDRKWAHSYLGFGFSLESTLEAQSLTNFYLSYNKNDLNDLAGEFRAVAAVGAEPKISAEIYQPVNIALDYFVSAKVGLDTNLVPTFGGGGIVSLQRFRREFITASAGKIFNQTTGLSLGLRYNNGTTTSVIGPSFEDFQDFIESYYFV